MTRALSVTAVLNKKRKVLKFDGRYLESFGRPEIKGSIFIFGESGHGKTSFVLQLCKYLCRFGRVAYDSLEEGDSESMKIAFERVGMRDVARRFVLLDRESMEDLKVRLRKHKAPKIVVIDSIQYTGMTPRQYKELLDEFTNVLFIIISHADGKKPRGKVAQDAHYHAGIKVRVEGYKGFVTTRYRESSTPFVIWEEGARKYHGDEL